MFSSKREMVQPTAFSSHETLYPSLKPHKAPWKQTWLAEVIQITQRLLVQYWSAQC